MDTTLAIILIIAAFVVALIIGIVAGMILRKKIAEKTDRNIHVE